jgi:hypothetical protein
VACMAGRISHVKFVVLDCCYRVISVSVCVILCAAGVWSCGLTSSIYASPTIRRHLWCTELDESLEFTSMSTQATARVLCSVRSTAYAARMITKGSSFTKRYRHPTGTPLRIGRCVPVDALQP